MAALLLISATANAQDPATTGEPVDTTEPEPSPPPEPIAEPEPDPEPTPTAAAAAPARDHRPALRSIGIGAGFQFPADFTMPSVVSVRLRWTSSLTFEPIFSVSGSTVSDVTTTAGGMETENEVSTFGVEFTTAVRLRLASRGPIDFVVIALPGVTWSKRTTDPNGPDNATEETTTSFGVGWGIGLEWFLRPHWSLSFDAANPLFSIVKTEMDRPMMLSDTSRTTTNIGATFDPVVRLMGHLYF